MPLDPVLKQLLDHVPVMPEGPPDYPVIRQQAEAMMPMIVGPAGLVEVESIEERQVDGPAGDMPLRIYRPSGKALGTLHYIHGGGWAVGNLNIIDPTARRLCRDLSMVVVTSTYPLAPEHRFPAAFDDSLAAARWVSGHRHELAGADLPAIIGGDSAGGNLAAAICIAMRDAPDRPEPFDLQLLLYPAVDLRGDAPPYASRARDQDPTLTAAAIDICVRDYAGAFDANDPRLSPLAATDLTGLPPALIVVLAIDPLHDEAVAYAEALGSAGVEVELMEFDNLTHGFVHFAGIVPAAAAAAAEVVERLAIMLARAVRA